MLGFKGVKLSIEKCNGKDLRGVATYAPPFEKDGYMVEKKTFDYQSGKTITYQFITLPEPNLVQKEDKINGFKVDTVKDVFIHNKYIVSEVTAL